MCTTVGTRKNDVSYHHICTYRFVIKNEKHAIFVKYFKNFKLLVEVTFVADITPK